MKTAELQSGPENGTLRRLAASGAFLGSLAVLMSGCGGNTANQVPPRGSLGNPYRNGDTIPITPGLTAKVVEGGHQVVFSRRVLRQFLHDHPNAEVDITMHNRHGNNEHIMIENGQGLVLPNVFGEKQFLECSPPSDRPEICDLTVRRDIARNVLLPGDPKVHKSADEIYRWPFKGSPSTIYIQPDQRTT